MYGLQYFLNMQTLPFGICQTMVAYISFILGYLIGKKCFVEDRK
jgi:hypothetical protein